MAITKNVFPTSGTPTVPTDYTYQNEYIERNARGYNAVSLTNWDSTTTKPQIAAGSVIECNGATWDVTTNTDISTTGASSGTVYVVFDDATPEFKFTNTAPTWSATLNGWYTSGDRFTGHLMTWDGASVYSGKALSKLAESNINNTFTIKTESASVTGGTTETIYPLLPPGVIAPTEAIYAETGAGTGSFAFQVLISGSWEDIRAATYTTPGTYGINLSPFVSDGVNYRIRIMAANYCSMTVKYGYKQGISVY